jgi:hypothetical protein
MTDSARQHCKYETPTHIYENPFPSSIPNTHKTEKLQKIEPRRRHPVRNFFVLELKTAPEWLDQLPVFRFRIWIRGLTTSNYRYIRYRYRTALVN